MAEKKFTGIYVEKELLDAAGLCLDKANCKTRNEFITKAIQFYIAYLTGKTTGDIISSELESIIEAKVQLSETRISRMIFKLAVELGMTMNVFASAIQIDESTLNRTRGRVVEEIKSTNGNLKFEDVVKYQKR